MESIALEITDFTLRCRSVLLSHRTTGLPRGLEPGEQVVLHDPFRGYHAAHVADVAYEPDDTVYRLQIDARLTPQEARDRLEGRSLRTRRHLTKQDLIDLLAELRAGSPVVPAPRHRRADTAL